MSSATYSSSCPIPSQCLIFIFIFYLWCFLVQSFYLLLPQAYQHLGEVDFPKFTVIVAQKNHHTKLFQAGAPENVPPGMQLANFIFRFFWMLDVLGLSDLSLSYRDSSGYKNCASKKLWFLHVRSCRDDCESSSYSSTCFTLFQMYAYIHIHML